MPKREAAKNPFKKPRPPKPRKAAVSASSRALAGRSPSWRTEVLGRERDRLLREIARRKRELERLTRKVEETLSASRGRIAPVLEQHRVVELEVHALFADLLRPRRLSKPRRSALARLYAGLRAQGLVDEPPRSSRAAETSDPDEFEEGEAPRGGGYSAPRAEGEADARLSLRALFKRLALALHPDRVRHEDEKARRTEAMKEVTRAYESGDLARLLEIEKRWSTFAAVDSTDAEAAAEQALERTVVELKEQLRELFAAQKALRRSDSYRAAEHLRRVAATGVDPAEAFVAAAESDLNRLRDIRNCLHAFAAGRLSWDDLLSTAPFTPDDEDDEDDEDFDRY